MEFGVLGPLVVTRAGVPVEVNGHRQQVVLAALLLAAPRVLGVDALVDAVWPDAPPTTARGQVQICVSRLRKLLDPGPGTIRTRPPGYAFDLDGARLDLAEFDADVERARRAAAAGGLDEAAEALRAALGRWRGEPLAGVDSPTVRDAATRLADRRLGVVEDFADVELRRGRHADVVDVLAAEVDLHPLRDRLRGLLMLALYRCGRQADALAEFQRARRHLADELGLDPGPELRELEQAILRGDPALAPPAHPAPVAAAGPTGPGPGPAVPRMLPPPLADFVGRARTAAAVEQVLEGADGEGPVPVVVLSGPGGIGKSALATHVARRMAARFPDGQLYATLHGAHRSVRPTAVLERFLRALGVPGPAVPESLEDRVDAYRDLLAGRRVLVVLDDVASVSQVGPLLPPDGGSAVVVTSRRRVTALPGARRVELGVLRPESALALLERVIGEERVRAEPEEAAELCRLCGHLPLAVRIAAARLAARPHWSPATMVDRLSEDAGQLDELRHEDLAVRATLMLAYETLAPEARRLLRLLSLVDAPDVGGWAAPVLLGSGLREAQDRLAELVETHLVEFDADPAGGEVTTRYRLHDLVRLFARERAAQEDGTAEREEAVARFLGAFAHLLDEAHRREHGGDYLVLRGGAPRTPVDERTVRRLLRDPLRWLAVEQQALVAAVAQASAAGADALCWELALGSVTLFEARAHFDEWRETHAVAMAAARRSGDRLGEAAIRYSQGALALVEQDLDAAERLIGAALAAFTELRDAGAGDVAARGVAMALRNLATVARLRGDAGPTRERYAAALEIFRETGDRVGLAHVLCSVAQLDIDDGDAATATARLTEAAALCAAIPNRRVGAQVAHRLGEVHLAAGRLAEAETAFADVLRFAEAARDPIGEVYGLVGTGAVLVERAGPAGAVLERAARLAGELGQLRAQVRALVLLSRAALQEGGACGRTRAREHADAAVAVARRLGGGESLDAALRQVAAVSGAGADGGRSTGC